MNPKSSLASSDDVVIRRIVTELIDEAPRASSWSRIEQRAERATSASLLAATHSSRRRPAIMLAAATSVLIVGVAAAFAVSGGDTRDRLVPADSAVSSTVAEAVTPTTQEPAIDPVPPTVPVDTVADLEPTFDEGMSDDEFSNDVGVFDVVGPVDYPERALADVTAMPVDAWVVAGSLPDGISPRYATTAGGERIVAYGDTDGRSLTVMTSPQPWAGQNTIDVDGALWSLEAVDGESTYVREIGAMSIIVNSVGIDQDEIIPVLRSLRTGGDQLVPVNVLEWDYLASPDADLVAIDDAAFRRPATFRAQGADGWYCIDVSSWSVSQPGCGFGRNGQLSSEAIWLGAGGTFDEGPDRLVLAGIVAPEVAEIEVSLADGTSDRTATTDLTGIHDDLFWILEVDLASDDPFVDRFAGIDVNMLTSDGTILGKVPLPS